MPAILFGSISTVIDTSELQRAAFNEAFTEHGLDWQWSREDYQELLAGSGGEQRIAEQADARGEEVDAAAVHRSKSEAFRRSLAAAPPPPRDGVVETIREAKADGYKVGLVTTTSEENVRALIGALDEVDAEDFDVIVDLTQVEQPKPDPAAYALALDRLGERAGDCVAIEDNLGGVDSAKAAGVACAAFPNQNTAVHDFGKAAQRVDHVDFAELRALAANG